MEAAARGSGHELVGVCPGGNPRTCWLTPAWRDAVKLEKAIVLGLAGTEDS